MDEYNVPDTDRPKWFKFHVFGGWGVAGLMFTMLIHCFSRNNKMTADAAAREQRIYTDVRTQVRAEVKEDFKYMFEKIESKDRQISVLMDSLKRKL